MGLISTAKKEPLLSPSEFNEELQSLLASADDALPLLVDTVELLSSKQKSSGRKQTEKDALVLDIACELIGRQRSQGGGTNGGKGDSQDEREKIRSEVRAKVAQATQSVVLQAVIDRSTEALRRADVPVSLPMGRHLIEEEAASPTGQSGSTDTSRHESARAEGEEEHEEEKTEEASSVGKSGDVIEERKVESEPEDMEGWDDDFR
mmetsp:Transcript_18961/g.48336  ORF Transcript_18961/g.48336 Transcript_18961/m.48336 type:complete len:206 (+) Transcript_18961:379-996(+)